MQPGIRILAAGRPGLAEPLGLDALAALGGGWAEDVAGLGPWRGQGEWLAAAAPCETPVIIAGPCSSTQDVLAALAGEDDLPPWTSLLSPEQRAGRGQLRRAWLSPPGNLYVSSLWPVPARPWSSLLPLLAGMAASQALGGLGLEAKIKWPNDVLLNGRKVVGILVEDRGGRIIVGMGVNCRWAPPASELRREHAVPAGSLAEAGLDIGPLALWLALWPRMREMLLETLATDPQTFVRRAEKHLAFMGREVAVKDGESVTRCRVLGLAPDGGLRVARLGREQTLYSGSILDLY